MPSLPNRCLLSLAAAAWLAIASPSSSRGATLASEDAAMLDALATLLFNVEEGKPIFPDDDPVTRQVSGNAIDHRYVEPSPLFGSTDPQYKDESASKYRRVRYEFRLSAPCVIRVENTAENSQGDSKQTFGLNVRKSVSVFDLRNHRQFEFHMSTPIMGGVAMKGDKILCTGSDGSQQCFDEYTHPVVMPAGVKASDSERASFAAHKLEAAQTVTKRCPGRSG